MIELIIYVFGCIITFGYFEKQIKKSNLKNPDYNMTSIVSVLWPLYWGFWLLMKIFKI